MSNLPILIDLLYSLSGFLDRIAQIFLKSAIKHYLDNFPNRNQWCKLYLSLSGCGLGFSLRAPGVIPHPPIVDKHFTGWYLLKMLLTKLYG